MTNEAYSDGETVLNKLDQAYVDHKAAEARAYQELPAHQRKELRFMKRLGQRHLMSWPGRKEFPRYKL